MSDTYKISFVSLGCDKNAVDSEIMLSLLTRHGYELTKDDAEADVIIINTCAFIQSAQEESINTILEMAQYKKTGKCRALVVTGCLSQRYAEEFFREIPEVDAIVGTGSYEQITQVLDDLMSGHRSHIRQTGDINTRDLSSTSRYYITPGYYEYLKIAEGCSNHCTYCVIPSLRGRYRSRRKEYILKEAADLASSGVKEVNLVAQDITKYGRDLYPDYGLTELLKDLCRTEGIEWIRLLYCYPEDVTDELIQTIKNEPKICHYIDIPVQHCSDSVLKRMARRSSRALLTSLMEKLRREIPDICIRTTLITGFPGETEAEFEEMKDFIRQVQFDRLGVFPYSQEEGTPAARMPGQIPEEIKQKRQEELMSLQKKVTEEISQRMIGREVTCLVEGRLPDEQTSDGSVYSTRTYRDAPDIDGFLFVTTKKELSSGDMIRCKVTGAYEYDLIGELL